MALPVQEAFTNTNETDLNTHNASWVYVYKDGHQDSGVYKIYSNACYSDTGTSPTVLAIWTGDTFNNNQYSQGKIIAVDGTSEIGVIVRGSDESPGRNGYLYFTETGNSFLYKAVADTHTQLGSNADAAGVNDVIYIDVSGTTITPKINGSTTGTPGAQTASDLSSGDAGLTEYHGTNATRIDDWEGGNLVAGTVIGLDTA